MNDYDRLMTRLNNDILFIEKSDKVVFVPAVLCIMVIAVNAAVLDWMLTFFLALMYNETKEVRRVFCFLYVIPSLFFFSLMVWRCMCASGGLGRGRKEPAAGFESLQ